MFDYLDLVPMSETRVGIPAAVPVYSPPIFQPYHPLPHPRALDSPMYAAFVDFRAQCRFYLCTWVLRVSYY